MKNAIIIFIICCFGCQYQSDVAQGNISEEVEVILNTFENGIVWVSKNDFKDMYAEIHDPAFKTVKRLRKYTVTDSLLSMREFRFAHTHASEKSIKKSVPFQFNAFKYSKIGGGFEIVKTSKIAAELDSNYNGNLTFSRVIFNKSRNRAKYYFEQNKMVGAGRGWGMGTYIYAKKIKGVWIFDKEEEVWIV